MLALAHGGVACTSVFPSGSAVQMRAVLLPVCSLALRYPLGFSSLAGSLAGKSEGAHRGCAPDPCQAVCLLCRQGQCSAARWAGRLPSARSCRELPPASRRDAGVGHAASIVASDPCSRSTHETVVNVSGLGPWAQHWPFPGEDRAAEPLSFILRNGRL